MGRNITTVKDWVTSAELDARLVDATHQGRLDATVSSRLASSDISLEMLKPPNWIHGNGLYVYPSSVSPTITDDLSCAAYPILKNTSTWQTIYTRTGRGATIFLGVRFDTDPGAAIGFRFYIDNVLMWTSEHTANVGNTHKIGLAAPVGVIRSDAYFTSGYPLRYTSNITIEAYDAGASFASFVYHKEYRY